MRKLMIGLMLAVMTSGLAGCFFTKIVSVPMRVVGAAVSIVPVIGNTGHDVVDEAADIVDELPI